jgi:phosphatidylinositol alpha-mannosyltransferase
VKIVLVTEFYYPHLGGVTEHVHHLARYLSSVGHEVAVLTNHVAEAPRRPDEELVGGERCLYRVVRVGRGISIESNGSQSRVTVGFGLERKVRAVLRGADLVHVQSPLFPMLPYLALKVARRLGIPTVGTFHTNFEGSLALRVLGSVVRKYSEAIDRPLAVSESAARAVEPFMRVPCEVVPNGVDVAAWASGQRRPDLEGTRNVLFLGRLDPRNDVGVLIEAFHLVAKRHSDVRLVLVGDGPRRREYEQMVSKALCNQVVFAGSQAEIATRADFLASADVMAFTARIVSHPMALIEGMAAGRPVVAYNIEGVRDLISDGREGYRVPVGDAVQLAGALDRVLADDAHRRVMGRLARVRATTYDWSHVAMRIETIYRSLVREAPPVQPTAPLRLVQGVG